VYFSIVLIERDNGCTNGATCSNLVLIQGTAKAVRTRDVVNLPGLEIRGDVQCDASATCSTTLVDGFNARP
jgi:hypothetical protein